MQIQAWMLRRARMMYGVSPDARGIRDRIENLQNMIDKALRDTQNHRHTDDWHHILDEMSEIIADFRGGLIQIKSPPYDYDDANTELREKLLNPVYDWSLGHTESHGDNSLPNFSRNPSFDAKYREVERQAIIGDPEAAKQLIRLGIRMGVPEACETPPCDEEMLGPIQEYDEDLSRYCTYDCAYSCQHSKPINYEGYRDYRHNPFRRNIDERLRQLQRKAATGGPEAEEQLVRTRARAGEVVCSFPECNVRVYPREGEWCFDCNSGFCNEHAYCLLGCMADNIPICCTADTRSLEDCNHVEYEDDRPDRAICALHSICCFPGCEIAVEEFAEGEEVEVDDECPDCGRVFCDDHRYCTNDCEADGVPICCTADDSPLGDYLCAACSELGEGFLCASHVMTCSLCTRNQRYCPNHMAKCIICKRDICTDEENDCLQSCTKCRREVCKECVVECNGCGALYCPPCLPSRECNSCVQAERSRQRAKKLKEDPDFQAWLADN
jgi:hypothetical protein